VGLMQAAFEAGISYAQERNGFGRAVFDYQLSKAKLARMAALIQAGRPVSYDVARKMAAGGGTAQAPIGKAYRVCAAGGGNTRGHATARRHGLRRGVPRFALLRRRACSVDLRRRRRDTLSARDRTASGRTSARLSARARITAPLGFENGAPAMTTINIFRSA